MAGILALVLLSLCVLATPSRSQTQSTPPIPAATKTLPLAPMGPTTFSAKNPTLFVVGYSHLDTEWRWAFPQVISEFLPNTLNDNFALFPKYPDYVFNWTGSNRYRLMKEYYPGQYATLKKYVAMGRWFPAGSCVEEGDVDSPSEESIIRQVLYANEFFRREFGVASNEFMIPDCFGFPASLPSIFAHCGLTGFSTQKLTWGSAVGIPFNYGVWVGPDGRSVEAALNPGAYDSGIGSDLSHDQGWIDRVNADGSQSGDYTDFRYYGTGDRGGAPSDDSVAWIEKSIHGGGPLHVVSARASDIFSATTPAQRAALPRYKGDLLLTQHSTGSLTSEAAMKRWNRKNERLADATERASVIADWLGAAPYDRDRITDAWLKFLPGQFHDLMAGTAIPQAYWYIWNDEILAMNEFAGVLTNAAGGAARALNTETRGVPIVVYNPLSIARQDVATATVTFPVATPMAVRVFGPGGREVPSQVTGRSANTLTVIFLASAPAVGYAVYDVRPAATPAAATAELSVSPNRVENARYIVKIDSAGDIASIYDKKARREILQQPARIAFLYENPTQYPAWNMDWDDASRPPRGYVDGPAQVKIVERGPVLVALQVTRTAEGSTFVQTISLAAGNAGDSIQIANMVDWKSSECALKAVLPLTVSNSLATYNWELGTIQRGNDDPKKYEVPSHEWFDLTDRGGAYGVSVLDDCKYGSDKPNDNTLRLTLLYTPGVRGGYQDQATQDWGRQDFTYAIAGHAGDWRQGGTQWQAMQLNNPLITFLAPRQAGNYGREFSFCRTSTPDVSVEAMKKAENSQEIVVRLNELAGVSQHNVRLAFAAPILSAREVDGQERPTQPAGTRPARIVNGELVFDMLPYRPRAFAITIASAPSRLIPASCRPLPLPYNTDVESSAPGQHEGRFDRSGSAIPAEMLPATVNCDGISFRLGPNAPGVKNAVACAGQTIALPAGHDRKVYLLAASSAGDTRAIFAVGDRKVGLTIQNWDGFIGQWDKRLWGGKLPELAYDWSNPLAGLVPGFIKRDTVAWYSDHKRLANGANDPYAYCYLFRYEIGIPDTARTLILPRDANVKLLAASVAYNPNADTAPAEPLYDTLQGRRRISRAPAITPSGGTLHNAAKVSITEPFYWQGTLRYTTDGSAPTAKSAAYTGPFWLDRTTTIRAADVAADGQSSPVATDRIQDSDTTPPHILRAEGAAGARKVIVAFSEPISPDTAANARSWTVSGKDVTGVSVSQDGLAATLSLASPLDATAATLTPAGVTDLAGNPIRPGTAIAVDIIRPVYRSSGSWTFDGSGTGYASDPLPGVPAGGASPWSMNLFVRPSGTVAEFTPIGGEGELATQAGTRTLFGGPGPAVRWLVNWNDGLHFLGGSGANVGTNASLDTGKWQMLTVTFDGSKVVIYKNAQPIGESEATLNATTPLLRLAPPGFRRRGQGGQKTAPPQFTGDIAGVTLWNSALDSDEVKALLEDMPG